MNLTIKFSTQIIIKYFSQNNRTLIWKPNVGKIELDILMEDKVINATVSPIHATIIWHFQNKCIDFYLHNSINICHVI